MYRYYLLIILLVCTALLSSVCRGQDAIVTIQRDTIHCKIFDDNDLFVYYITSHTKKGEMEVISYKEVKEILRGTEAADLASYGQVNKKVYDAFFFSGKGGYSRLIDDLSEQDGLERAYYNRLSSGYWFSIEGGYMFDHRLGVSAIASRSRFMNSATVMLINSGQSGPLADDIVIDYFGLQVSLLFAKSAFDSGFFVDVGVGLHRYKNDFEFIYPFELTGNAIGANLTFGYRVMLAPGLYIPLQLSVRGFQVMQMEVESKGEIPAEFIDLVNLLVTQSEPYGITRIEIGAGLIISF